MKLLIIRPQPGADATAARVQAAGHEAVLMPLFEIKPVEWDIPSPDSFDALLITSGNAVRAASKGMTALFGSPVYAVGAATARAANLAGLTVTTTGEAGLAEILGAAKAAGLGKLLWLAGEDRTDLALPDELTIDMRVVYRSAALPLVADFTPKVRAADVVLLHSPRAARHFATLCNDASLDRSTITLGALSSAIAKSAGSGWRELYVAPSPDDASLLSQVQSCFTNIDRDP